MPNGLWSSRSCRRGSEQVGRGRHDLREVVKGTLYLLRTGCPWRLLPKDFPPRSTVQRHFCAGRDEGICQGINYHSWRRGRPTTERPARVPVSSTASRSRLRKAAGPAASTPARRSRAASDTSSPIPTVCWSAPSFTMPPSRTATAPPAVLEAIRSAFSWLRHVFADSAYPGAKLRGTLKCLGT